MCLIALTMHAQKCAVLVFQPGTKVTAEDKDIDTSGYVDLGLSVKWATCNLGATKPEEWGDYYAWGETYTKSTFYTYATYKWTYDGTYYSMNKYNTKYSYGVVDKKKVLDADDDVARVKLGDKWRIPTRAEWKELQKKCTWTWTTQGGVVGYKVTSKTNGNSIFLPAAGYLNEGRLRAGNHGNYYGYYWSSSLCTVEPCNAWNMLFYTNFVEVSNDSRSLGMSVRPVTE